MCRPPFSGGYAEDARALGAEAARPGCGREDVGFRHGGRAREWMAMNEYQAIRSALIAHSDWVLDLLVTQLAYLGSRPEWSADDNFDITEDIARLAERIGLPGAGDQTAPALTFYRAAATHLGIDLEDDEKWHAVARVEPTCGGIRQRRTQVGRPAESGDASCRGTLWWELRSQRGDAFEAPPSVIVGSAL